MFWLKKIKTNRAEIFLLEKTLLFVIAFVFSYLIRIGQIYAPLSTIEYVTSHNLITIDLLYKKGLSALRLSPRYTYDFQMDKNIPNMGGIKDKEGNYYYVSYPPFTFLFPYLVFKSFHIYPSPVSLRVLNVLLHFVCSFFIFLILSEVFGKKSRISFLSSYGGFLFYLLSPGNLFFHTNYFFSDILAQVFFIGSVYFFVLLEKSKKNKLLHGILMLVFIFLTAYTEWIGYLFGIVLIGYLLAGKTNITKRFQVIASVCTVLGIALLITLIQYSSVSGFKSLIDHLAMKYTVRGGYNKLFSSSELTITSYKAYLNIIYFYYSYYLFPILLIIGMIPLYFFSKKSEISLSVSQIQKRTLFLAFSPVILHYILFFNFNSVHSFSTLKTSFFLSILFGVLLYRIIPSVRTAIILLFVSVFIFSIYHPYEPVNYYDDSYKKVGERIRIVAKDDELVFVCNDPTGYIQPQLLYYAKRNILYCTKLKSAKDEMNKRKAGKAILFYLDINRTLIKYERI